MGVIQTAKNIVSGLKPGNSGQKWISLVDKYYRRREKSVLQQLHRQWFINIAYRRGYQNLRRSLTTGELLPPERKREEDGIIVNKMLGAHTMKVAKLSRENPVWTVSIDTEDEDSRDMARYDELLLKYAFQREDMELKRLAFLGWAVDTGNSFWKIIWDHDLGGSIEDPFTGEMVQEGDVKFIEVPPFDMVFAFGTKTRMEDSPWIMHVHEEPLSTIKDDWEEGSRVKGEKDNSQVSHYQKKLLTLVGNQGDSFGADEKEETDTAIVKELYIKQCSEYPEGAYIAISNGIWLNPTADYTKPSPLPYKHLRNDPENPYPFTHMIDIPVSGSPWGIGTMENLLPVQSGENRVWRQVIANGDNFGNIKLLAEKGGDIERDGFDDSADEVLYYDAQNGQPPQYLTPTGMPNHVMGQFDLFAKSFMEISGQFEATKGDVPTGVKSGVAIARLQDADDTRVNPTMIQYRSCLKKAGKHVLSLYREFMQEDEERTVKIIGENGVERHKISRDKLNDNFTVYVDLQSSAAWSREVRREQIQNAYQMGLFGDPNDGRVKRRVLEALEFGHLRTMFEDNALDEQNAKDNIDRIEIGDLEPIEEGQPTDQIGPDGQPIMTPPVMGIVANPWEDHEEHIRVYNKYRKGPKWKKWPPEQKAILNRLADEHEKFLQPPPVQPEPPRVSISASTQIAPEVAMKAAGMEPPTPQPMDSLDGIPESEETGDYEQPEEAQEPIPFA
jgi:hypothetical protein